MNQLTELINNQNNSKRIKSNLEKKLEMIALKKVYRQDDQSNVSLTKLLSDLDFVIKIKKNISKLKTSCIASMIF